MTAVAFHPVADSMTMLRRNLKHMVRYPSMTVLLLGLPLVFLLLFVYVFGGTLGSGLGSGPGGRGAYLNYVVPGVIMLAVSSVAQGTSISVAMDLTGGIIARFRTMAITRSSVLTGHVLGAMIQTVIGLVVVVGVAVAIDFRPTAGPLAWLAAFGLLLLITFALTWLTVALGLVSNSVETASNTPMILTFLPLLGSGFVPTNSMPGALRWFAEYQPYTPMIQTLRGLLTGGPVGSSAVQAIGWCLVIAAGGYAWSRSLYRRRAAR